MNDKDLEQQLEALKQQIEKVDERDQAVRGKLRDLAKTIQHKLDYPQDKEKHGAVLTHLEEGVVAFKVKHPMISAELERLVDMLKNMGI